MKELPEADSVVAPDLALYDMANSSGSIRLTSETSRKSPGVRKKIPPDILLCLPPITSSRSRNNP